MKTIIRSPKGTNRREVSVSEIVIPDLWHITCRLDGPARDAVLETWRLAHDLLNAVKEA